MYPIRRKRIALNMLRVHGTNTPEKVPRVLRLSAAAPGPGDMGLYWGRQGYIGGDRVILEEMGLY